VTKKKNQGSRIRVLNPLKSSVKNNKLTVGFDIETYGDKNKFLMCSFIHDDKIRIFWDKEEAIKELQSKFYKDVWMCATNLMFDFFGLFHEAKEQKYFNILLRGSSLLKAQAQMDDRSKFTNEKTKHKIEFIDTMNFLPASVKKLGRIIGVPKLECPEFLGEKPKTQSEREQLERYNVNDSFISKKFIDFLRESFNDANCKMRITIASTAMDYWRRNYLKNYIVQPRIEALLDHYPAYFGGRTEVFKRGFVHDLNYYDFNSLYPSVMVKEYPDPNSIMHNSRTRRDLIQHYEGISEVEVTCPEKLNIPILPYRDEKVLFPGGTFKGTYTHAELRHAKSWGYRIRPAGQTYYYTKKIRPFKEFVTEVYEKRKSLKKEKNPLQLVYKLLMNSLYGKFGQKITKRENIVHESKITLEALNNVDFKRVKDYFIIKTKKIRCPVFVLPIFSIYTTAYARIKMYDAMRTCDPYYVDTDSILTPDRLRSSDRLGALKMEYYIKEGWLVKPKMYYFDGIDENGKPVSVFKVKGVMKAFKPGKEKENFRELLLQEKVAFERFAKFKEALRSSKEYKLGQLVVNQRLQVLKNISLEDNKRDWDLNFSPHELQDSEPIILKG